MKKKLPTASSNEIIPEGYKALLETLKRGFIPLKPKQSLKPNLRPYITLEHSRT